MEFKNIRKALDDLIEKNKDQPDFIQSAEVMLFGWEIVMSGEWSRTDLMQMIKQLEDKLGGSKLLN